MDSVYSIESESKHPINIKVEKLSYLVELSGNITPKLPCFKQEPETTSTKMVLDQVSFSVKSGQMLAIMGSSGSGKTSLLNVLACRNIGGHVTGDIKLNGVKHTKHMIETFSSYVRQDDRLLQHLTVRESLMFVAQLKLPTKLTASEMAMKVDNVITELGLGHVANTRVGGTNIRGISGGERRRVSIGIQLLMNPSILFLDEPTSGLDAFTANHLMQTLGNLAKNQRTVVLSIHQPRSDIFDLFDMVLVLSMGNTVYFGEAKLMVEYFTDLGFPCPQLTNPSDFYLDLATVDVTSVETEQKTTEILKNLTMAYNQVVAENKNIAEVEESKAIRDYTIGGAMHTDIGYPGFCRQFQVLIRRQFKNLVIDHWFVIMQTIQALIMSMILGTVFWDMDLSQKGIRERAGFLFMLVIFYPYTITLDVMNQCHRERHFLYFELEDKLYGYFAYFLAKMTAELPFHIFFVGIYFTPAYFMANLQTKADIFFTMYAITALIVYFSKSFALSAANIYPSFNLSSLTSNFNLVIYIIFSGYFINLNSMNSGVRWMADVSPFRWALDSLVITEYDNVTLKCGVVPSNFCMNTGEEVLEYYGFGGDEVWVAIVIITAGIFIYQCMAFFALRFISQKPYET